MSDPIQELHALGQSIWYDNIQRKLIENGQMQAMVERGEIRGVTSNPSIFQNAIANSSDYDAQLQELIDAGAGTEQVYEGLAISDIQAAADMFLPLYEATSGGDGYVSLEVNPYLADDSEATCREAKRLWERVGRPNLMVKIPATEAGLPAISGSIADGININVTLIFSQQRYLQVMNAYMAGLERRLQSGKSISAVASVASFFVSRIDTKVDQSLEEVVRKEGVHSGLAASLLGHLAVANARLAYQRFKSVFGGTRFDRLRQQGGRVQRPLWASTSTKNPQYRDVKYVEELIGPEIINTMPPQTLDAFRDHGRAEVRIEHHLDRAEEQFRALADVGISFDRVTEELEREGVAAFAKAFGSLLESIDKRSRR